MSEEVTEKPVIDYNRLICAIVEQAGGQVMVTNEAYAAAKPSRIVDVEDGYIFLTVDDEEEVESE